MSRIFGEKNNGVEAQQTQEPGQGQTDAKGQERFPEIRQGNDGF